MEDAFHCNFDSVVVRVDRFWVMRPAGWVERLSGGQEGFDSFVSEDEQRSHRSEPGGERLVAAGMADPADDVFAAEFLRIIPAWRGPYWHGLCLLSARTRAATSEAVKPLGEGDKAISASTTWRIRALLRSMPPTRVLPTREASGRCSSMSSAIKH
jgi:hypothetical protein